MKNKFDFINIQNIFWHINIDKWESVLNNLFLCLKTKNVDKLSLLNITFTDSRSAFMSIHQHFVPISIHAIYG